MFSNLFKMFKHYVSEEDYFLHKTANKPLTLSQKAHITKIKTTEAKRDGTFKGKNSKWQDL
tara:strand:+ start:6920 stop:7102 length:183 start_codon:yes stop_codon:yes gene_type:complete